MTSPEISPPTFDPAPAPADRSSPPTGRRRWALSEIICWGLVAVLCGLAAVMAMAEHSGEDEQSNPTFSFMAQYAVGVHELNKGGALGGAAADTRMLLETEKQAKSAEDQLRAAVVAGEFQGREEALRRIADLTREHPEMAADADTATQLLTSQTPEPAEAALFRSKYGWFADLAESIDKPAGDPLRGRTIHTAMVVLASYAAILLGVLALVGTGLILLIITIVLLSLGKVRLGFSRFLPGSAAIQDRRWYLQGFVIYMAVIVLLGAVIELAVALHAPQVVVGILALGQLGGLLAAFTLGFLWPLWRERRVAPWRAALGLHLGRGFFREVGSGIVGYLAGVPIMAVGYLLTAWLASLTGLRASHPIERGLNGNLLYLVLIFGLACVWAPVTEELMFRGALFAHLRERFGWWISAPVVALVFAIIHPQGWIAVPALGAIAIVLAGIREWRGSIIGCMTAHALHNALTLAAALVMLRGM